MTALSSVISLLVAISALFALYLPDQVMGSVFPRRTNSFMASRDYVNSVNMTVGPYGLDNINCQQAFYDIDITSDNTRFQGFDQTNMTQSQVTALILEYTTSTSNFTDKYFNGTLSLSKTFNISGTLCTPTQGGDDDKAIQLLVHGVGFDSSYWDFQFSPYYSYVRHAASHGYATFRYDRIGTGQSDTPTNGFDVTQTATELNVLVAINGKLRNSTDIGGQQWSKVVGIGHSYGSILTQGVTAVYPDFYDAVVLTGFSANSTYMTNYFQAAGYSIASETLPDHLADKPPVWLVTATPATNQLGFWAYPHYDDGAFQLARATEQPVTLGSMFTAGSVSMPAPGFTNPVQVVTGDRDFIFAGADAYAGSDGSNIPAEVQTMLYPNVDAFETYIPANTGHAVNQHYSASQTYEKIVSFIERHNL